MPRDRGPFKVNERVVVPLYDQLYYEAKVTKAKKDGGKWYYLLHYKGWGKQVSACVSKKKLIPIIHHLSIFPPHPPHPQWDEWLESASILKWSKELAELVAKGGAVRRKDGSEPTSEASREAVVSIHTEPENDVFPLCQRPPTPYKNIPTPTPHPQQLFLNIPDTLKKHLKDQQALITSGAPLPSLPVEPSVFDILAEYRATLSKPSDALTPEEEAALALGAYFDRVLTKRLLYEEEQEQARKVCLCG